jgi:pimeloyl-ACP methyl ester carboxylesterase
VRRLVRVILGIPEHRLTLLTAGARPSYASQELFDQTHTVMVELHRDLAHLSTAGIHRAVPDASHYIHEDRPEIVIEAVREVVEEARGRLNGGPKE